MTEDAVRVQVSGETDVPVTTEEVVNAVRETARTEGVEAGEFSVTFLDRDAIADLNRAYLGRSDPTDVIAFDLGDGGSPLGDIYICPAEARASAGEYGVEVREELLRLVIHGVLHVLGHEHPDGPERAESDMFRRQESILSRLV